MDFVTFFSGTIAGAVVLYLVQSLFQHRLAKSLSATDRKFIAAREFRAKVNEAMTLFQKTTEQWSGNNRTAHAMRNFVSVIDLAAKDFAEFFTGAEKTRFTSKWNETKDYCNTTLPRGVTSDNTECANQAKKDFLNHVNELLSYAKTT